MFFKHTRAYPCTYAKVEIGHPPIAGITYPLYEEFFVNKFPSSRTWCIAAAILLRASSARQSGLSLTQLRP